MAEDIPSINRPTPRDIRTGRRSLRRSFERQGSREEEGRVFGTPRGTPRASPRASEEKTGEVDPSLATDVSLEELEGPGVSQVTQEPEEIRLFFQDPETPESKDPLTAEEQVKALKGVHDKLGDLQRVEFITPDFSSRIIANAIERHFSERGEFKNQTAEGKKAAAEDITAVLATGIGEALATGDPTDLTRALGTVSSAVKELSQDGEPFHEDPQVLVELLDSVLGTILGTADAPLEEKKAEDLDAIVDDIFGADLDELANGRLSTPKVLAIRKEFDKHLLIKTRTRDQLESLQQWLRDHVADPVLKQTLLSDVARRIRVISAVRSRSIRDIPVLLPISEEQVAVVTRPLLSDLGLELDERLSLHEQARAEAQSGADREAILKKIRGDIAGLNRFFSEHKIRRQGSRTILHIKELPKTTDEALNLLQDISTNVLGRPRTTFTYVPRRTEGRPQDANELIRDLRSHLKQGEQGRIRRSADIIHAHHDVSSIGLIRILTDVVTGGKELVIPPETPMTDLLKLAKALSMESGILVDQTDREQLVIKKGETTAGTIVSYLQELHRLRGAHVLRVLYTPDHPEGGLYVGGALSSIFTRKVITPSTRPVPGTTVDVLKHGLLRTPMKHFTNYGGAVKVSDVAAGVGSIATGLAATGIGAPIALPVAAVSSVVSTIGKLFGL